MKRLVARLDRMLRRFVSAYTAGSVNVSAGTTAVPELIATVDEGDSTYAVVRFRTGHHQPLSQREAQVASLACQGHPNARISSELGLSSSTVDSHMRRIFRKLCIHSRVELACHSALFARSVFDSENEASRVTVDKSPTTSESGPEGH